MSQYFTALFFFLKPVPELKKKNNKKNLNSIKLIEKN